MNQTNRRWNAGIICISAALVWIIAISIEYPFHLQPPSSGALYFFDRHRWLRHHDRHIDPVSV